LNKKRFILASKSPRRHELLAFLIEDFSIESSDIEEIIDESLTNEEVVMDLALQKAQDISKNNKDAYVLGFDTLVILDGKPLGKPKDTDEAFEMLSALRGRTHRVLTGCAIVINDYKDTFYEFADVTFTDISDEEIHNYIETKEPMDKAGSYGIQKHGAKFVTKVNGDFYTVMGMPIHKLYERLKVL
jgi:septum formation protein